MVFALLYVYIHSPELFLSFRMNELDAHETKKSSFRDSFLSRSKFPMARAVPGIWQMFQIYLLKE